MPFLLPTTASTALPFCRCSELSLKFLDIQELHKLHTSWFMISYHPRSKKENFDLPFYVPSLIRYDLHNTFRHRPQDWAQV